MRCVPVLGGLGLFRAAHSTSDEMMFKCEPRCAGYNKPGRRQQRSSLLAIWGGGLDPRSAAYYASSRIQCLFSCLVLLLLSFATRLALPQLGVAHLNWFLVLRNSDRALMSLKGCRQRRCVVCK